VKDPFFFSWVAGELSLRESMPSSLRGELPTLPIPRDFSGNLLGSSQAYKVYMNLRSPCNKIQVGLAEFCILVFNIQVMEVDRFLAVVNWTVLGFCEMLQKFLLILSDTKIFFFSI